ncbi:acyltransferase family protein [Aliiroseovarius sp.]|uniref:acyltransferase family protein n=1 Tax=Aliiroseovarius sp. TaxID=1872442 RepID=UPI002637426B|nr:acyltransferase family protein [Aliiroseovarius sp.]
MHYRREIDGLRTVAVLPVILFHGGFTVFSGGYVGVDVFFVISGFLITTILLGDLERGEFSLLRFYERRARRILPALFTVMVASVPFAWALMMPVELRGFGQSLAAVSLFISNVLFWQESGYFDTSAEEKPLLHTWSLAVEEQYYLLFPVLLFFLWRTGRNPTVTVLCVLSLISLSAAEWGVRHAPTANFYLIPFRAWELFAGSICALLARDGAALKENGLLGGLGLGLIAASVLLFDSATPFPSLYALVPVIGTVLVILYATPSTLPGRLLATRPMVGIGLISYSAYLWHQPMFAYARLALRETPPMALMSGLALASLALAWLSWRYIEAPFRRRGHPWLPRRWTLFTASITGMVLWTAAGAVTHEMNGFPGRFSQAQVGGFVLNNVTLREESWQPLREIANDPGYSVQNNAFDRQDWAQGDAPRRLLLVGNSHSKDVFNMLAQAESATRRFALSRFGLSLAEALLPETGLLDAPNYKASDTVVLASLYFERDLAILDALIARLQADGKQVVVMLSGPVFSGSVATGMADEVILEAASSGPPPEAVWPELQRTVNERFFADQATTQAYAEINARVRRIAETRSATVLDRGTLACDADTRRCNAMGPQLEKHFYDASHLSPDGSRAFARQIDETGWFDPVK